MGFDERCPHCGLKLEALDQSWRDKEYQSPFITHCEHCDKAVQVTAHMIPEFETERLMCVMCNKIEVLKPHYCGGCLNKLQELSDHNQREAELQRGIRSRKDGWG